MGSYETSRFIIEIMKTDFFMIVREKLESAGFTVTERPGMHPSYVTNAPESVRMTLHNDALIEMREKYEGRFSDHKLVQAMLDRAIRRSIYSDKKIEKAKKAEA